jgi:hypothetical protein
MQPSDYPMTPGALEFVFRGLNIPVSLYEYRCPFDFIDQFDLWFEFHRRLYFEKEDSCTIVQSMLNTRDVSEYRIADHNYSSAKFDQALFLRRLK